MVGAHLSLSHTHTRRYIDECCIVTRIAVGQRYIFPFCSFGLSYRVRGHYPPPTCVTFFGDTVPSCSGLMHQMGWHLKIHGVQRRRTTTDEECEFAEATIDDLGLYIKIENKRAFFSLVVFWVGVDSTCRRTLCFL